MYNRLPWETITSPATNLNLIRIDDTHPHDFSWGKDAAGKFLLVLKFRTANIDELKKRKLELNGIKTDMRRVPATEETYFQLALQSTENADIFYTLCNDLIEKTRTVPNIHAALTLIYARLDCWRTFLSKANRNLLSAQEVQGLFGELKFLEECIEEKHVSIQAAIEGWQGPLGAPHDFIFGQSAVEMKSISGSQADSVRISSESQLITHLETLHMRVVFLAQDTDCRMGLSLNDLIRQLREKIRDNDLISTFDSRLFEVGYIDIPEYDFPCFSVTQIRTYEIREGFPRITPESLFSGISEVSYSISFSSIAEYICNSFAPGGRK